MISYIEEIIVPFIQQKRDELGEDENQAALAIFNHFKGQLTEKVTQCLEKHNIHSVLVSANCTDRLQLLDLTVNKPAKNFLRLQFQSWYADKVSKQYSETMEDDVQPVDLSTPRIQCLGAQWLMKLFDY